MKCNVIPYAWFYTYHKAWSGMHSVCIALCVDPQHVKNV